MVACPCALVLATPATVLAAMAWLARHGVLIKGGVALERLAGCDTFAFDKTGTLTLGRPELASVVAMPGWTEADVIRLGASAEQGSKHPLAAVVLKAAAERGVVAHPRPDATALPAKPGSSAPMARRSPTREHTRILVGNRRLPGRARCRDRRGGHRALLGARRSPGARRPADRRPRSPRVVGLVSARDAVRPEAHDVIHDLKHLNITEIALLTGDRAPAARAIAKKVHIKAVESELLPAAARRPGSRSVRNRRPTGGDGRRRDQRRPRLGPSTRRHCPRRDRRRPRGRGGGHRRPRRAAPGPSRPGEALAGDGADHPPEYHHLRVRAERRGDGAFSGVPRHPRADRRGGLAIRRGNSSSCSTRCASSGSAATGDTPPPAAASSAPAGRSAGGTSGSTSKRSVWVSSAAGGASRRSGSSRRSASMRRRAGRRSGRTKWDYSGGTAASSARSGRACISGGPCPSSGVTRLAPGRPPEVSRSASARWPRGRGPGPGGGARAGATRWLGPRPRPSS